jgi:putative N6-adenine-specific DNA methylase
MNTQDLFISCLPGLEPVLGQELSSLGYSHKEGRAGCFVPYESMEQIYRLNLSLRTASRVLLPLHSFVCRGRDELYKGASEINWYPFFQRMPTFMIDTFVMHKNFTNSLFAAQVVKDAICDQLRKNMGSRPSVDTSQPELGLHLYLVGDQATISFDTSNPPLHVRGYRLEGGVAPLRENLAAALLLLAGYKADDVLVDPCCGSGTFLIEAALIASNTAPGLLRGSFGIFGHPQFNKESFESIKSSLSHDVVTLQKNKFLGIEASVKAFGILKRAIHKSKFDRWIQVSNGDFRTLELPIQPNFVIANPPYGVRLNEIQELEALYENLGDFMKQKTQKPATGAIFTGNLELAKKVGLKTAKRHVLSNGGIECRLLTYELY